MTLTAFTELQQSRVNIGVMKSVAIAFLHVARLALALVGGFGEFATLQRWRLKEWIAR